MDCGYTFARRTIMNHLRFFLYLVLLAAVFPAFAQDSSDTISAIEFKGIHSLTSSRLQSLIGSRVGESYDPETIRNDIKALSGVARKVEVRRLVEPTGIKIVFIIEENRAIRDISIVGNTSISTDRLMKTIPINRGDVLASDAIAKTREKILKDYRAAGRSATNVRISKRSTMPTARSACRSLSTKASASKPSPSA